jgi:hypothetical protein
MTTLNSNTNTLAVSFDSLDYKLEAAGAVCDALVNMFSAENSIASTYTAAVYVGDFCTRLKNGLTQSKAIAFAENYAKNSDLNISEIAAIRD